MSVVLSEKFAFEIVEAFKKKGWEAFVPGFGYSRDENPDAIGVQGTKGNLYFMLELRKDRSWTAKVVFDNIPDEISPPVERSALRARKQSFSDVKFWEVVLDDVVGQFNAKYSEKDYEKAYAKFMTTFDQNTISKMKDRILLKMVKDPFVLHTVAGLTEELYSMDALVQQSLDALVEENHVHVYLGYDHSQVDKYRLAVVADPIL